MIIGIDGNEANQPSRVGVGQYSFHLLTELFKQNDHHVFKVFLKNPPLADLPPISPHWQYHLIGPKPLWTRIALPLHLLTTRKINYFYSPTHYSPYPSPIPTIPTIHDIGYLQFEKEFTKKDFYQLKNWTEQSIRQSKHLIAVSQFTKDELIKTYHLSPASITIINNGVDKPPTNQPAFNLSVLQKFNITQPFFLSVGTLKPNKNYPFLISAFAKFLKSTKSNYQLVIAGKKGWLFDQIFSAVIETNTQEKVIFTNFISEAEKWSLYRQAIATILPSTYEGFGIPAIESQLVNTPVICSRIPSFVEVLGNNGNYIDPHQPQSLINAIKKIISSPKKPLPKPNYSWEKSGQELLKFFDSLS